MFFALAGLLLAQAENCQCNEPAPIVHARQMEALGRGVVAIKQEDGNVFISWRLTGTDARDIAFNLYRTCGRHHAKTKRASHHRRHQFSR